MPATRIKCKTGDSTKKRTGKVKVVVSDRFSGTSAQKFAYVVGIISIIYF